MSRTAVALLALAVLVALTQWVWMRSVEHVDVRMLNSSARRRVRWIAANSGHIQLVAAAVAVAAVCLQAASLAS
jgi:hypothetical protein